MGKVDGFSKRLDWNVKVENNNKNQKVVKEEWIQSLVKVVVKELEVNIIEKTR